jgi:predicted protein tyrosine phosphatase
VLELIFSASRAGAEAFTSKQPFAVVSITDPGSRPASLRQRNVVARCNLEFWDLYEPGDGRAVFDTTMARRVLDFVARDCAHATLLLVHCEAGISRSTGVANALGRVTGIEVRHQHLLMLNPNPLVERILEEEARLRGGLAKPD